MSNVRKNQPWLEGKYYEDNRGMVFLIKKIEDNTIIGFYPEILEGGYRYHFEMVDGVPTILEGRGKGRTLTNNRVPDNWMDIFFNFGDEEVPPIFEEPGTTGGAHE